MNKPTKDKIAQQKAIQISKPLPQEWRTHFKQSLKNRYDDGQLPIWFVRVLFVIFQLKHL